MKPVFSVAVVVAISAMPLHADDVALLKIRVGKEKQLRSVAIEFYEADAPRHVENFKKLARKRFYN